ncbi:Transcription factor iws1 [Rhodotorula kratochvilovae]
MSDTEERPQETLGDEPEEHTEPQEDAQAEGGAADQPDIFEDSDLTELEDSDNEDGPRSRSPSAAASPAARRSRSPSSGSRSPSPGARAPASDAGDEYREDVVRRLPKIAKKKRTGDELDDEAAPRPRKKKAKSQRQPKEVEPEEDEDAHLDPEARRRKELSRRITAAAKKPAGTGRSKKRKQQDEEDLEMMNDEAVATLRSEMLRAAEEDIEENNVGRPALNKLRLLPKVVDLMQKTALHDTIVENGMLEAVKRWLEPLPDKSLPALNIQRPLISLLRTINIETSALKSSELGKVIYFYTKCKRVDPPIARMASQLVGEWMRPILRRSKAFVDRDLAAANSSYASSSQAAAAALGRGDGGAEDAAQATRHARIPQALTATYAVAPSSRLSGQSTSLPGQGSGAKMRGFKQKMQMAQQAARRG